MSNSLTSEQMDKKIDEKTIIQNIIVEFNPILDTLKVLTANRVPISNTEKYSQVKNTINPLLFNMPMKIYSSDQDDIEKNKKVDEINEKEKFRTVVI